MSVAPLKSSLSWRDTGGHGQKPRVPPTSDASPTVVSDAGSPCTVTSHTSGGGGGDGDADGGGGGDGDADGGGDGEADGGGDGDAEGGGDGGGDAGSPRRTEEPAEA